MERQRVDEAISLLEKLGVHKRRGRPPKWARPREAVFMASLEVSHEKEKYPSKPNGKIESGPPRVL